MKADHAVLDKLLAMSKFQLEAPAKIRMGKELNNVLDWVAQLQEVDTTGITPLAHMGAEEGTPLREDEPAQAMERQTALRSAPKQDGEYVRVPGFLLQ